MALGLDVHLGDQGAGGVEIDELRRSASAGTDFGTPWAEKTTGRSWPGISSSSSTKTAPLLFQALDHMAVVDDLVADIDRARHSASSAARRSGWRGRPRRRSRAAKAQASKVLAKEYFTTEADFGRKTVAGKTELVNRIKIPRADESISGVNFEIVVGFDLTEEQLAFNRGGNRFRLDAASE
jgi:hypothetical protein